MAMIRYVALAAPMALSREASATISSTAATVTTTCSEVKERMSCMAGLATICFLPLLLVGEDHAIVTTGSGTSSIVAKARTTTVPTRTTMWTVVARRKRYWAGPLDSLGHRSIAHIPGPKGLAYEGPSELITANF